jgi:hypothetical protein
VLVWVRWWTTALTPPCFPAHFQPISLQEIKLPCAVQSCIPTVSLPTDPAECADHCRRHGDVQCSRSVQVRAPHSPKHTCTRLPNAIDEYCFVGVSYSDCVSFPPALVPRIEALSCAMLCFILFPSVRKTELRVILCQRHACASCMCLCMQAAAPQS